MESFRNIIVIGASAGGFHAIDQVISGLSGTIDAAVFVVIHISDQANAEILLQYYQKNTSLTCTVPKDGTKIQRGYVYIAPANYHMMVKDNTITINQGARENKYRPSIDVLFRSAAAHYGHRAIGVILTGMLDDGTSGMSAIKRSGGICMVQDPSEAEHSDMPQSVINHLEVDYRLPLKEIGPKLMDIISRPLPPEKEIPTEIKIESDITENMMIHISKLSEIADQTAFTCPECGGGLWAVRNEPVKKYRCYTGHVYTESLLNYEQIHNLEESVWVSIRMLEERRNLLNLMATNAEKIGNTKLVLENTTRADDMEKHASKLKTFLARLVMDHNGQK